MRPAQHLFLPEAEIVDDAQVRKQFEMLEHHADPRAQFRQIGFLVVDLDSVEDDLAGIAGLVKATGIDSDRVETAAAGLVRDGIVERHGLSFRLAR